MSRKTRTADPRHDRSAGFAPGALPILSLIGAAAAIGWFADELPPSREMLAPVLAVLPGSGCTIKGNISAETGERIYHLPGQRYYLQTRISPAAGERWFCSEEEAEAAGWRKSRR